MKGFTLIELSLVIGAAIIIAVFTLPLGIKFFQTQALDETAGDIQGILRRAQNQAVFQKSDSSFGVKFLSDSYILFQGSSYNSRTQGADEEFILSSTIETSGIDEVVFEKMTGIPNSTGTIKVTSGSRNQIISINIQGKIERE
jgi:Tfp pilus assembly protein FimT